MTHKYRSDHAPHNQPDPQTERESQLSVVSPQSLPPPSRHYYTRSLLKMFAVANTSALRVSAKAPVTARRTVAPKAALVADLKKVAKKAAPAILTATTTMLPAAAALAEEEVTPIDLKLAIGFTVAIGIAAFSTLPEPESSKHGGEH